MTHWINAENATVIAAVTVAAMYVVFRVKDTLIRALGKNRTASGCSGCACSSAGCGIHPRNSRLKKPSL